MCFVQMLYCDCDLIHTNSYSNVAPVFDVSISIPLVGQFGSQWMVVVETERETKTQKRHIICSVCCPQSTLNTNAGFD